MARRKCSILFFWIIWKREEKWRRRPRVCFMFQKKREKYLWRSFFFFLCISFEKSHNNRREEEKERKKILLFTVQSRREKMIFDVYDVVVAVVILAKYEERVSRPMRVRDLKKKKKKWIEKKIFWLEKKRNFSIWWK